MSSKSREQRDPWMDVHFDTGMAKAKASNASAPWKWQSLTQLMFTYRDFSCSVSNKHMEGLGGQGW